MKSGLRSIRGAVLMGMAWAVVWAPIAVLVGVTIIDPDNSMDEMWVAVGAYPGFLCGVLFYAVLGLAAERRRLNEVSLNRAAASGAVTGVLVGVLPLLIGTPTTPRPLLEWFAIVTVPIALLSVVSAVASAMLARAVKQRALPRLG
jgi:hypothetical protein